MWRRTQYWRYFAKFFHYGLNSWLVNFFKIMGCSLYRNHLHRLLLYPPPRLGLVIFFLIRVIRRIVDLNWQLARITLFGLLPNYGYIQSDFSFLINEKSTLKTKLRMSKYTWNVSLISHRRLCSLARTRPLYGQG